MSSCFGLRLIIIIIIWIKLSGFDWDCFISSLLFWSKMRHSRGSCVRFAARERWRVQKRQVWIFLCFFRESLHPPNWSQVSCVVVRVEAFSSLGSEWGRISLRWRFLRNSLHICQTQLNLILEELLLGFAGWFHHNCSCDNEICSRNAELRSLIFGMLMVASWVPLRFLWHQFTGMLSAEVPGSFVCPTVLPWRRSSSGSSQGDVESQRDFSGRLRWF